MPLKFPLLYMQICTQLPIIMRTFPAIAKHLLLFGIMSHKYFLLPYLACPSEEGNIFQP